jgi:hypothetical protein
MIPHDESDPLHVGTPAEICRGCSDLPAGRYVPVSFCEQAKAAMEKGSTT